MDGAMTRTLSLSGRHYRGYPATGHLGEAEQPLELDASQTALMLIDVYGRGFDPGAPPPFTPTLLLWSLFELQKKIICERIRPARDAAMHAGLPIIYVENYSPQIADNRSEFGAMCVRTEFGDETTIEEAYAPGSAALAYSDVIAPPTCSYRVRKQMYDGFFETPLDSLLRNLGIKSLVCVGFSAEICLLCTMIGGMYRNYRMVLLRDGTLGTEFPDTVETLAVTKFAIRYVERLVGFTTSTENFIDACNFVANEPRASGSSRA
jgi:nicotinamidase-related amidase